MPQYTFKINELENRTVDAFDLEGASSKADIAKGPIRVILQGD
jgi:hypothetical protein